MKKFLRRVGDMQKVDTDYQGTAEVGGAHFKTWRIAEGCDWRKNGRKKTIQEMALQEIMD